MGQIESKPGRTPKFTFDTHLFRLTFTFEFIRRPISPILSPSSRTFVELTLVSVNCDKVPLLCDNESAIKIAYNLVQHSRTKHIEIRNHFIRDHVARGDIELAYVSTKDQLADIFTEPLDEARFGYLRNELNIIDSRSVA